MRLSKPDENLRLGNTDVRRIGLGTNRLRDTDEDIAFIRDAVDAGVQMIDTAHLYTGGESEKTIGRALSSTPSNVIVATKGGYGDAGRGKPEILRREIEQSLASLRVGQITLYYLHRVDPETPPLGTYNGAAQRNSKGVHDGDGPVHAGGDR